MYYFLDLKCQSKVYFKHPLSSFYNSVRPYISLDVNIAKVNFGPSQIFIAQYNL